MRIFFASTIGFQVPVKQFGSGKVILQGLLFTLALLGKLVVGFMVPNFTQEKKFTGNHLRDCLIVGCSMVRQYRLLRFVLLFSSLFNGLIHHTSYLSFQKRLQRENSLLSLLRLQLIMDLLTQIFIHQLCWLFCSLQSSRLFLYDLLFHSSTNEQWQLL